MFDAIRQFLEDLASKPETPDGYDLADPRLAAVVLLVHAMNVDGNAEEAEKSVLDRVVLERFGLNAEEREKLIAEAEDRDREAVDLYGFTSVLKNKLSESGRLNLVRMLWQIVYADGTLHEFEDNLVWRVAELLGVSSRDRVRLRKEVESEIGIERF